MTKSNRLKEYSRAVLACCKCVEKSRINLVDSATDIVATATLESPSSCAEATVLVNQWLQAAQEAQAMLQAAINVSESVQLALQAALNVQAELCEPIV